MDWEKLIQVEPLEVAQNEELSEALHSYIISNELQAGCAVAQNSEQLLKILGVVQAVLKVKGEEAQAGFELAQTQSRASEQDLLDRIIRLEKDLRRRDATIQDLKQKGASSVGTETRSLREQIEVLQHEKNELNRLLEREKSEAERLSSEASQERLKSRQKDRELERLDQTLQDLRTHMDSQKHNLLSKRAGEPDLREHLRKQDKELAEQLDKMEELVNVRDNLEKQLHTVTLQLGKVEEQRILAVADMEKMRAVLVESDKQCEKLQAQNQILGVQVSDLQEQLKSYREAEGQHINMVSTKTKEWESTFSSKQAEIADCHNRIVLLEEQLKVAQLDSDRALVIRMKKQLQDQEEQVSLLQGELAEASHTIEQLSSQLKQTKRPGSLASLAPQSLQVDELQKSVADLKRQLEVEVQRRKECELQKEEKDLKLVQLQRIIDDYESGEYGLREAVQEIKKKKEEIAARDKDLAELARQVSQMDVIAEENEALREKLGLRLDESFDMCQFRQRKAVELEQLKSVNRMLQKEVERLEEEKRNLRKQLLEAAMQRGARVTAEGGNEGTSAKAVTVRDDQAAKIQDLTAQVSQVQVQCELEREKNKQLQQELSQLVAQNKESRELAKHYEAAITELSTRVQTASDGEAKCPSVERLVALLEARSCAEGDYDVLLQLKGEVSVLSGQNIELRRQVAKGEQDTRAMLQQLERKQCEVEHLQEEVDGLKKACSGFQPIKLPEGIPLASSDIIANLNEHLLHTLKELHSREAALAEAQATLEKCQRKFSVVIHQQGIVYREYLEVKRASEAEKELLMKERNDLQATKEQDQIHIQELKQLQDTLSSDQDVQKQRLGDLSRKVTILKVNEKISSRRYTLLLECEATLKKENHQLRQDLGAMEKAVTERLGYLQRFKEASIFKLSSLQNQLLSTVPLSVLDLTNRQHSDLVLKCQDLLQRQAQHDISVRSQAHLQAEVSTLTEQLSCVKQELEGEKRRVHLLEQQLATAGVRGAGEGGGHKSAERLATLEMQALSEKQRADLALLRHRQAKEMVGQLELRNSELEEKFSELTHKLLQSQAKEVELCDQLANSLSLEDKAALEAHCLMLEKSEMRLRIENDQLKEVAEVARQQGAAMEMWQKSHDLEVGALRQQLLDFEMQSDENTRSAVLHRQMIALQISEASTAKKLECANSRVLALEASLLKCEQQRDGCVEAVSKVRAECHSKVKHLRAVVQNLRMLLAGALPLAQQEKHAELVRQLQQDKMEAQKLREEAAREHSKAEEKVAQLEIQQQNLQELIAALTDVKTSAAKVVEWHAKLGEMRLGQLKLTRTVERLQEEKRHLEDMVSSTERAFVKLEQDLVQVTRDYETAQLSWEQKELELEQRVERAVQEASRTLETTHDVEVDRRVPPKKTGEKAEPLKKEGEELLRMQEQLKQLREQNSKTAKALTRAEDELLERDKLITNMKKGQVPLGHVISPEQQAEVVDLKYALNVAQDTVEQLKTIVSQKEMLADKYQKLLQEARRELQQVVEAHKGELTALAERLRKQEEAAFSQRTAAALSAANPPMPVLPTGDQLVHLKELEELVAEQQKVNTKLAQQLQQVRVEAAQTEQDLQAQLVEAAQTEQDLQAQLVKTKTELIEAKRLETAELQKRLDERASRLTELEQEVEVMKGELSAAHEAARQAPSKTLRALVDKLRDQLAIKEKQHQALTEALLQVRADLVEATQKTLESQMKREVEEGSVAKLVEKRTSELQSRMETLADQLNRMKVQLEDAHVREKGAHDRASEMELEVSRKNSTLQKLEEDLRAARRSLEQAKSREMKITKELEEANAKLQQESACEELQKRVHILQEKVDKQRRQIKDYEQQLKARQQSHTGHQADPSPHAGHQADPSSHAGHQADPSSAAPPQVESKHSSVEVLKWEEGKRWQKKVESLKAKLSDKGKELEVAQKQITSLKEIVSRADREKSILSGKLKAMQKTVVETPAVIAPLEAVNPPLPKSSLAALEEQATLKTKIFELENEVQKFKRELHLSGASSSCEPRITQMEMTIKALEAQLLEKHPGSSAELRVIRDRERALQEELLASQKENLTLRFDYEQASVDLPRLKGRIQDLEQYAEVLKTAARIESKDAGSKTVADLEQVIVAMRKVVERLQSENNRLKKSGQKSRVVAELELENKVLKNELEKLRASVPATDLPELVSKMPYAKIVAENDRLRKELAKAVEKIDQLQLSLSTSEVQNSKLKQEVDQLSSGREKMGGTPTRRSKQEEQVEVLQAELEKKTHMLLEVKKHLRDAAEREQRLQEASLDPKLSDKYIAAVKERDMLKDQVVKLKKELDAFDPAFFEEIEDLKYNYQEALKRNVQYEEQLTSLSRQYGFPLPALDT